MTRIRGRHKRRYRVTTDSRHKLPVAQNVLNRNFTPAEPNQVFTSDITYVWSDEGWLYHDRRAGDGVVLPPSRAPGALHHSDRGSQYASHEFQRKLCSYGMRCLMSRKGNCWERQRADGKLLQQPEERAGTRHEVSHASRSHGGLVRIHRSVLQPTLSSFIARLHVASSVHTRLARGSVDKGYGCIARGLWARSNGLR